MRLGCGGQGGVVGGGDGPDDREPEAVMSVARCGAVGRESLEGLEQ